MKVVNAVVLVTVIFCLDVWAEATLVVIGRTCATEGNIWNGF